MTKIDWNKPVRLANTVYGKVIPVYIIYQSKFINNVLISWEIPGESEQFYAFVDNEGNLIRALHMDPKFVNIERKFEPFVSNVVIEVEDHLIIHKTNTGDFFIDSIGLISKNRVNELVKNQTNCFAAKVGD